MKGIRRKRFFGVWQRGRAVIVTLLAFAVLGIMASFFALNLSFLNPIKKFVSDFSMTDLYYDADSKTPQTSPLITIVDMTELIRRADLAETLVKIEEQEPKVVGVDMVFYGLKEDSVGDRMIRDVAAKYSNIVWSIRLDNFDNATESYTYPYRSFFAEETGATEAVTNMLASKYGRMKRQLVLGWRFQDELLPSFIGTVANRYAETELAKTEDRDFSLNFTPTDFTVLQWDEVEENPDLIADRIVLFGAMHDEVDMHITPLGKMPGLQLLAYGVQTLIKKNEVREIHGPVLWTVTFLIVLVTYIARSARKEWVKNRRNPLQRLLLNFPIVGSLISFAWVAFLMWMGYVLFNNFDISFNPTVAFSAIAFLGTAEESYNTILNYIKDKINEENTTV